MSGIYSITPFSLLDFPDHISCIIWFAGCNMRCLYCYNPEIVFGNAQLEEENVLDFLNKRKHLLEGVVLSGGECTLYPKLIELCAKIKKLGYRIKIDTNGCRPKIIKQLINESLIDYVALDYKAPLKKFKSITQSKLNFGLFAETLEFLCVQNDIKFEVRTTVHSTLLQNEDIQTIQNHLKKLGYKYKHYLQCFKNDVEIIGNLNQSNNNFLTNYFIKTLPVRTEIRT